MGERGAADTLGATMYRSLATWLTVATLGFPLSARAAAGAETPAETSGPDTGAIVPEPDPEPNGVAATPPAAAPGPTYDPGVEPEPTTVTSSSTAPTTATSPATDDEVAPGRPKATRDDAKGPVQRFAPGQWGMTFTFGGLAPMSITGANDYAVNRLLFTELGFRRVFEHVILPFSVGAGVFHHKPGGGGHQTDVGLAGSIGVLGYFRVWRRIAPHFGGLFRVHYVDPSGSRNWQVGLAVGPVIGIEYFVGDRVSLLLQGNALLGLDFFDQLMQVHASTNISAGGQMGLTFYF